MNNTEPTQHTDKGKPRLIFIVLVLIFSAPLLSSWIIFNYTDLINSGGMQHGDLYEPLVKLNDVKLDDPYTEAPVDGSLYGKWSLLYMSNDACGEDCRYKIYSMRQIRLAVSRYAKNLQRVWMTSVQDRQAQQAAFKDYEGTLVLDMQAAGDKLKPEQFAMPPVTEPLNSDSLYVIDPEGYLVMRYRPGTDPEGIISDVKRLLKTSSVD